MLIVAFLMSVLLLARDAPDSGAPPQYTLPIVIADSGGRRFAISLGVHPEATDGFDAQLGERPIPPVPDVAAFDIRFLDPNGRKAPYPGLGSYLDVRPYRSRSQVDTFYVRFQPRDQAYPMLMSWPVKIREVVDSAFVVIPDGGGSRRINMLEDHAFRIMDDTINTCMVVVYGVRPVVPKKKYRGEVE